MKIIKIYENSSTENSELKIGDNIVAINGNKIKDFIDFQFYTSEENLEIDYIADGQKKHTKIQREYQIPLGIQLEEHKCRTCANNCIFCFVDQIKPGLRKGLNIKDDDYLYSFVFGNFITLTNLSQQDFDRIVEQHLSPLYVSVHTTNNVLHKKMMRHKHDFDILEKIDFLVEHDIELHTQIVVVPGWNDGEELEKSIFDLAQRDENILSIGVVPVGLTKFRTNLLDIDKIDQAKANQIIEITEKVALETECNDIYCSDELFLTSGREIPDEKYYNEFPQIENGIGMIRVLLENWENNKEKFINEINKLPENLTFVCGYSIFGVMKKITDEMNSIIGSEKVILSRIKNKFFGDEVTVSGLLTAEDIFSQTELSDNWLVVPKCIFNHEEFTLDEVHFDEIFNRSNNRLLVIEEDFSDWEFFEGSL